ncbi:hypothetical protein [Flavobacterium sp. PL02]|uniref:hypothetical protein n=1 Tax=Flavobacterium sp. PL02 TaxID=3088354 RepID=UPI002B230F4B|nr:hypothetical protein [Flavobacterium sp. PL02]MEA9414373.1 hypothetical protein [Flavobacterium sp. PL02]
MTANEITNRLDILYNVLLYCSEKHATFSKFQRICINQERGALLSRFSFLLDEISEDEVRDYKCPPEIEAKIQFTLQKIKDTNWLAFEQVRLS